MATRKSNLTRNEFENSLSRTEKNLSSIKNKLKLNTPYTTSLTDLSTPSPFVTNKLNNHQLSSAFHEDQLKMMANINHTIQMLTYEVSKIKEKQHDLERVVVNSDGLSLDRIERELRSDIDGMKAEMKHLNNHPSGVSNQMIVEDLTNQMKLLKRQVQNTTDSLHREMDAVKSRIDKLEGNMSTYWQHSQSTLDRYSSVERDLGELSNSHRQQKHHASRKEDELQSIKKELNQLSEEIYGMKLSKSSKRKQKLDLKKLDDFDLTISRLSPLAKNQNIKKSSRQLSYQSPVDDLSISTLLSNFSDKENSLDFDKDFKHESSRRNLVDLNDSGHDVSYDDKAIEQFIDQHEDLLYDNDDDVININHSIETDFNNNKWEFDLENDDVILNNFNELSLEKNDSLNDVLLTPSTPLSLDNSIDDLFE